MPLRMHVPGARLSWFRKQDLIARAVLSNGAFRFRSRIRWMPRMNRYEPVTISPPENEVSIETSLFHVYDAVNSDARTRLDVGTRNSSLSLFRNGSGKDDSVISKILWFVPSFRIRSVTAKNCKRECLVQYW